MGATRTDVPESAVTGFAPDYSDSFRIASVPGRTAAEWAAASLRGADGAFSRVVWQGILGFDLSPGAPGTLVGWTVVEDSPTRFVMRTEGRLMAGQMVFEVSDEWVQWTTSLRYHGFLGPRIWSVAGAAHRRLAPQALEGGRRRLLR